MCGRIGVQRIYTDNLVVCTRSQVFVVRGEADRVDCARVMADGRQLLRLGIFGVVRVQDSFGRPDTYVAVCLLWSVKVASKAHRGRALRSWFHGPPAAVTSRFPSGETWQLYTSWSFKSPRMRVSGQRIAQMRTQSTG